MGILGLENGIDGVLAVLQAKCLKSNCNYHRSKNTLCAP